MKKRRDTRRARLLKGRARTAWQRTLTRVWAATCQTRARSQLPRPRRRRRPTRRRTRRPWPRRQPSSGGTAPWRLLLLTPRPRSRSAPQPAPPPPARSAAPREAEGPSRQRAPLPHPRASRGAYRWALLLPPLQGSPFTSASPRTTLPRTQRCMQRLYRTGRRLQKDLPVITNCVVRDCLDPSIFPTIFLP